MARLVTAIRCDTVPLRMAGTSPAMTIETMEGPLADPVRLTILLPLQLC